jgi:hypothetical protein
MVEVNNTKQIIPHNCVVCDNFKGVLWFNAYDRNYTYDKGKYYHKDCYNEMVNKDGRKGKTTKKK